MSKHVCVMTSVHPADDSRIYEKQIKSLVNAGYRVSFVNPFKDGTDDFGVECIKVDVPRGTRTERIKKGPEMVFEAAIKTKADIYHFHDPELLRIGPKLMKYGKVIFDSHEDTVLQTKSKHWIPKPLRGVLSKIYAMYEKSSAIKISAIITATENIKETFEKYGCKNITVVKNYPILKEFAITNAPKKRQVCYVGGITKIRGIQEMVDAMEGTDIRLALAGSFDTEELEKTVRASKGFENVDYFGKVGREKVAEILSESVAGLVTLYPEPNYINSLPIKMFEYMAAGIPIVFSNFEFWKQLAMKDEDSVCGIAVDGQNVEEIKNAIQYIFDHPEKAKEWGENGIRLANEVYNWKAEEAKLLALYKELLGE